MRQKKSYNINKVEIEIPMSSFMKTKDDNVSGIRDFILRKIQATTRLKELEVPIVDEFIVHKVLNKLPTSFDQLKVIQARRINKIQMG